MCWQREAKGDLSLQQNARIGKLDDFKWVAALLVAAIHTSPLESLNETADFLLTRVLARVAVPFFFMVTGFFVLYGACKEQGGIKRILSFIKKAGFWYLLVTVLYLPVQLYKLVNNPVKPAALAGSVLKAVFFDGTYYHLWYFPAVMTGLLLVYFLLRLGKKKAYACAGILYITGLFGDSYYGIAEKIPVWKGMYDGMFRLFSYTRNGLFFSPLFLLLGYETAVWVRQGKQGEKEAARNGRNFIISLIFMCGEGLLLHINHIQKHDSMYFILPICMLYLFRYLLLSGNQKGRTGIFYLKGPMLFYYLHPLVILLVRGFVKVTKLSFVLTVSPVYFLAVVLGSMCAVFICVRLMHEVRQKRGRN